LDADPASFSSLFLAQLQTGLSLEPTTLAAQTAFLLVLLLASAIFSGSEVALFSLGPVARSKMGQNADQTSAHILSMLRKPRILLLTILILNTLVKAGVVAWSAFMVAGLAESLAWSPVRALMVEMAFLVVMVILVSVVLPKWLAFRHTASFSRRAASLLFPLYKALLPVTARLVHRLDRTKHGNHLSSAETPAEPVIAHAGYTEAEDSPQSDEQDLIDSIVEFGETTVREIMVSRLDIVALPVSAALPEALNLIRRSGHSRLPLYEDHLDNILGIVYAKDLLPYLTPQNGSALPEHVDWTRIARPPMFVPYGRKLDDLLRDFQSQKMHLAFIIDEYGGTAGLVTLEDVLEEIVGDIRDEHDDREGALCEQIGDNTYRVDARMNLDDLNDVLDTEIDTEDFDFETLGGLIFHVAGSIPTVGLEIDYPPFHLRVETMDSHRIGYVILSLHSTPKAVFVDAEREMARD
jgi:putative hemolysin